jgi:hypothetical protein
MRRLVGFVLMMALMAPALAVCAGGTSPARPPSEHDCCPKDAAAITAAPEAPAASPACCRMSTDAAQRGAIQAVEIASPATPTEPIVAPLAPEADSRPLVRIDSHPESPHIARHLLLSVLLI